MLSNDNLEMGVITFSSCIYRRASLSNSLDYTTICDWLGIYCHIVYILQSNKHVYFSMCYILLNRHIWLLSKTELDGDIEFDSNTHIVCRLDKWEYKNLSNFILKSKVASKCCPSEET